MAWVLRPASSPTGWRCRARRDGVREFTTQISWRWGIFGEEPGDQVDEETASGGEVAIAGEDWASSSRRSVTEEGTRDELVSGRAEGRRRPGDRAGPFRPCGQRLPTRPPRPASTASRAGGSSGDRVSASSPAVAAGRRSGAAGNVRVVAMSPARGPAPVLRWPLCGCCPPARACRVAPCSPVPVPLGSGVQPATDLSRRDTCHGRSHHCSLW